MGQTLHSRETLRKVSEVSKLLEVWDIDRDRMYRWTRKRCDQFFGAAEFREVLEGYDPRWKVVDPDPLETDGRS